MQGEDDGFFYFYVELVQGGQLFYLYAVEVGLFDVEDRQFLREGLWGLGLFVGVYE